jgi:two-component system, NarL family, sensor histidine kinase BarA
MGYYLSNAQDYDEKYLAFVSNIHHDLMGPMTFIKGYSDLLLTESYGPLQESQREFIQRINRSVQRAKSSLEIFQKLATIESGILLVRQESVDLALLIQNIVSHLLERESRTQTLEVNIPDHLPAVKARFHEVTEIFSGLLEGTIAHSLPETQISLLITIETNSVKTALSTSNPPKPSNTDSYELSQFNFMKVEIFQRYIEQFGGEFGEESEEGKGSTVWFTLPIADEQTDI